MAAQDCQKATIKPNSYVPLSGDNKLTFDPPTHLGGKRGGGWEGKLPLPHLFPEKKGGRNGEGGEENPSITTFWLRQRHMLVSSCFFFTVSALSRPSAKTLHVSTAEASSIPNPYEGDW